MRHDVDALRAPGRSYVAKPKLPAVRVVADVLPGRVSGNQHVTKLKLLERQMYGRANVDVLRRRVLLAA